MARFIPFDPNQPLLLSPDLRDALPEGHAALLVGDVVEQLDLREITAALPDERLGGDAAARLDLRLPHGRALEPEAGAGDRRERRPPGPLAQTTTLGYWALNRFTRYRAALGNLQLQTAQLASDLGLVKLGSVAIDGTKLKAKMSKHKAMSYARMSEREAKLRADIEALPAQCRRTGRRRRPQPRARRRRYEPAAEAVVSGRQLVRKALVVIAVELRNPRGFGRVRLRPVRDASSNSLQGFVRDVVAKGATVKTDGWRGYGSLSKRLRSRCGEPLAGRGEPEHATPRTQEAPPGKPGGAVLAKTCEVGVACCCPRA